jgi:alpha-D-ribose 1-methylphosphonate 5-phosphate C-P lyase
MSKGFIIVEDYLEEIAVKMKKSFQRNSNISTTDETANESLTQRALKPTETQMIFDQVLETSHEEED